MEVLTALVTLNVKHGKPISLLRVSDKISVVGLEVSIGLVALRYPSDSVFPLPIE